MPLTTDYRETSARPPKVGRAGTSIVVIPLFFVQLDFAFGDASIDRAAENGNISRVHYADMEYTQVLGIFGRYEVIAYGE